MSCTKPTKKNETPDKWVIWPEQPGKLFFFVSVVLARTGSSFGSKKFRASYPPIYEMSKSELSCLECGRRADRRSGICLECCNKRDAPQ